jgi:PBP1b-binding outer membrane lipoprotein LpoB
MKRLFLILLVAFLFGCSSSDSKKESSKEDSKSTEEVKDLPLTEEEEKKMEELLDEQSDSDYIGNDARSKKKN